MSAIIIPFPANLPPRADINARIADARRSSGLAVSAERRAYMVGYMDGYLKNRAVAEKSPPRRRVKA